MKRAVLSLVALALLAGCENRDRLTDEEAAAKAAQGANELIVPPSGGELPADLPAEIGEVVYKALGTEPGWALTIRQGAMLYQGDYGTVRIVEASPPGFVPRAGTIRSGRLTVTLARGPCNDGMSDHVWRDKVTVAVAGGATVRGCGGGILAVEDPNAIEGTRFRVSAMNGAPIRTPASWWLSFANGQVSGQFGCNIFSGGYKRNGDHLSLIGGLSQNAAGCPATAAWDKAGQRILGSGPRIEKVDGVVRLVSEAGVIELSPS
jgi:heat shock protein HslJ